MFNFNKVRVVDVTLRDGGYRNNFNFSMNYIFDHLRLMQKVGVDFVEIGYRNGSVMKIENIGRTGLSENIYIEKLRAAFPEVNLGVIVHAKNITNQDIYDMAERGIKLIRFCIDVKNIEQTFQMSYLAKKLGIITTANIVRVSSYSNKELIEIFDRIMAYDHSFDVIYTADSNGNLVPKDINRIYGELRKKSKTIKLGFHAHDNIGQAMANTIMAIEKNNVSYVDASLLGMGKGIGNLHLEHFLAFLYLNGVTRYDAMQVLCATERLLNDEHYVSNNEYIIDVISGLQNFSMSERNDASMLWESMQI